MILRLHNRNFNLISFQKEKQFQSIEQDKKSTIIKGLEKQMKHYFS